MFHPQQYPAYPNPNQYQPPFPNQSMPYSNSAPFSNQYINNFNSSPFHRPSINSYSMPGFQAPNIYGHPHRYNNFDYNGNENRFDDRNQMNRSKLDRLDTAIEEERVYCCICSRTYMYSEREEHLQKHRLMRNNFRDNRINYLIQNYNFQTDPVAKPIVEPEEYNIQYKPNQYILQHDTNYATPAYDRPLITDEATNTDLGSYMGTYKRRNRPGEMNTIHQSPEEDGIHRQDPHNQSSQRERVRLSQQGSQDFHNLIENDYRQYNNQRRPKNDLYPSNVSHNNDIRQPSQIIDSNDHRFSRDTFVSDHQSQPHYGHNHNLPNRQTIQSNYRDSSIDKSSSNHTYMHLNTSEPIRETEEENRNTYERDQSLRKSSQKQPSYTYNEPMGQSTNSYFNDQSMGKSSYNDTQYNHIDPHHSQIQNLEPRHSTYYSRNSKQPSGSYNDQSMRNSSYNDRNSQYINNDNFRALQSSQVQNLEPRHSTYYSRNSKQPSGSYNDQSMRNPSYYDRNSQYTSNQPLEPPRQQYIRSSKMSHDESQIPFEHVVGQERGNLYYDPKNEQSLDIVENGSIYRRQ